VLRRLRRPVAALCAVLLVPALASCGDDSDKADDPKSSTSASADDSGSSEGELKEVSFSGEVGESITADWKSAVETPEETSTTTLVKGEGDEVAEGDTVSVYLWVGDGAAQKQVFSDYDNGAPEAIPYSPDQLDEVFRSLFEDQTYGSRVVAVTKASVVLGEEENQLGVDPNDALVIVADLVEKQQESPEPTSDKPEDVEPGTQPKIVEKDGKPTGLDFSGIEEPELDTPVQRVILKEGDGAELKASDTVTVDYLGSTYEAEAPFDESYSTGQPLNSPLSGLIQGWSIGLTGVKVGSRVLLQIPPAYGYGAQGSGSGIPGNATLWFVIDVVKAE
jgi:peptidylprolyl isomerase